MGLLNNSCDPNTCRVNVGRATLVYATRDIGEDEEVSEERTKPSWCKHLATEAAINPFLQVTDSYLPLGQTTPRDERRSELQKKYGFLCQCRNEDMKIFMGFPTLILELSKKCYTCITYPNLRKNTHPMFPKSPKAVL